MNARTFNALMGFAIYGLLIAAGVVLVRHPNTMDRLIGWSALVTGLVAFFGCWILALKAVRAVMERRKQPQPPTGVTVKECHDLLVQLKDMQQRATAAGSVSAPFLRDAERSLCMAELAAPLQTKPTNQ